MADSASAQLLWSVIGIGFVLLFCRWRFHPLYSIPTIGPSFPVLSLLGAYRYFRHAGEVLQEGYDKYKVFRVAMIDQWVVIVSGAEMNEELRKIPDSHATFAGAAEEFIQTRHTIAPDVHDFPIHMIVIRGQLTRHLGVLFSDVADEIFSAFPETIKAGEEWTRVDVLPAMAKIVSRASNRVFVGLPLCRDPDYLKLVVGFTLEVAKGRAVLSFVPKFLKNVVGPMLPWSKRALRCADAYVMPLIMERERKLREGGDDWVNRPQNDYIVWLIEEAHRVGRSSDLVVQGILVSNFAAIHTSSHSITHAIYQLAANPAYIQPIREEIEAVLNEHGWSKVSIGKMWKLDSFMRESQRINGIGGLSVMRKLSQDVTLSDGTYLPAGTVVAGAASATHADERYYNHASEFEGFRFAGLRAEDGGNAHLKHQFVNTSPEYVPFGHGKHACPGRFFAVNELKVMMAYIIINFDVKLEEPSGQPKRLWRWHSISPDPNVKVLFRKRKVSA